MTVSGSGFDSEAQVNVGGNVCEVTDVEITSIKCIIPSVSIMWTNQTYLVSIYRIYLTNRKLNTRLDTNKTVQSYCIFPHSKVENCSIYIHVHTVDIPYSIGTLFKNFKSLIREDYLKYCMCVVDGSVVITISISCHGNTLYRILSV